jgi:hypothetical protein
MQSDVRLKQSALLLDLLALCVAIGFVIGGLIVRDRLPIIPLADGDTWGYLYPELSWLSGLGFQQTYGRGWLYPALQARILGVSGDFCAITYVQRFLGLAGASAGAVRKNCCLNEPVFGTAPGNNKLV